MTRTLIIVVIATVAAAAAIAANVVLLGNASASNDPVGQLSPRAHLPAAPHWTVRPTHGRPNDGGADD